MLKSIKVLIIFVCVVFSTRYSLLSAEELAEFPQSGLLAANGSLPSGNLALPQLPMGLDGRKVPFVASLVKSKDNRWEYSIINKTDKKLKIQFEIAQYSQDNSSVRDRDFMKSSSMNSEFRIRPGSEDRGKVAVASKSIGAALILKGWSLE